MKGVFSWTPAVDQPPVALVVAAFAVILSLLLYPLHVPYLNNDQYLPIAWALIDLHVEGLSPWSTYYPNGLPNLLQVLFATFLGLARLFGYELTPIDLLSAYSHDPFFFVVVARLIAIGAGFITLVAVWWTSNRLSTGWGALNAVLLTGCCLMFVREHHHGMWDAPGSAAVSVAIALSVRYVDRPTVATFAAACAVSSLAVSFRYNFVFVIVAPATAWLVAASPNGGRVRSLLAGLVAVFATALVATPAVFLEPFRFAETLELLWTVTSFAGRSKFAEAGFFDLISRGLGVPLFSVAVVGAGTALWRRDRRVFPVVAFAALYCTVLVLTTVRLNRYGLPLVTPVAVLSAYAMDRVLPFAGRVIVVAGLIALTLPASVAHVQVLAREDTRVASARWLRENTTPATPVYYAGTSAFISYLRPDEAWLPVPKRFLGRDLAENLIATDVIRRPRWRALPAAREFDRTRGGVVLMSRVLSGRPFSEKLLGRFAKRFELVADFEVESVRVDRSSESPWSLPFTGLDTVLRPGPHIMIWKVPTARPIDATLGFALDRHRVGSSE